MRHQESQARRSDARTAGATARVPTPRTALAAAALLLAVPLVPLGSADGPFATVVVVESAGAAWSSATTVSATTAWEVDPDAHILLTTASDELDVAVNGDVAEVWWNAQLRESFVLTHPRPKALLNQPEATLVIADISHPVSTAQVTFIAGYAQLGWDPPTITSTFQLDRCTGPGASDTLHHTTLSSNLPFVRLEPALYADNTVTGWRVFQELRNADGSWTNQYEIIADPHGWCWP